MKKLNIFTAVTAAIALTAGTAFAQAEMEECKVIDKNGKGLIKAHQADCNSAGGSCAGQNNENDPEAWILVPTGECVKINAGDFSGVDQDIKDKVEGAK